MAPSAELSIVNVQAVYSDSLEAVHSVCISSANGELQPFANDAVDCGSKRDFRQRKRCAAGRLHPHEVLVHDVDNADRLVLAERSDADHERGADVFGDRKRRGGKATVSAAAGRRAL